VELEKSAGVVVGVELEVGVSEVGVLEGERLVMAVLELGLVALERAEGSDKWELIVSRIMFLKI
jgi:hypothetical protein